MDDPLIKRLVDEIISASKLSLLNTLKKVIQEKHKVVILTQNDVGYNQGLVTALEYIEMYEKMLQPEDKDESYIEF